MSTKNVLINIFTFHLPHEIAIFGRINNIWYIASRSDLIWRRFISFSDIIVETILRDAWARGVRTIKEDFEFFPAIRLPRYVNCDAHGQFYSMGKDFPETEGAFYFTYCKLRMNEIRNGTIKLSDVHNELLKSMEEKRREAELELIEERLKHGRNMNTTEILPLKVDHGKTIIDDIITEFDLDSTTLPATKYTRQKPLIPVVKKYMMGRIITLPSEMVKDELYEMMHIMTNRDIETKTLFNADYE